jgi:hypothetical protein
MNCCEQRTRPKVLRFLLRKVTKRQERLATSKGTKTNNGFLQSVDLTLSEDSTNLSRDVSISSKPSRHDISLPTADQLPFKQVDIAHK